MDKKIPVGVLGATGTVGQRFVQLLADHPWFEVVAVTGSDRTVGRPYGARVNWKLEGDPPAGIADLTVLPTDTNLPISSNLPVVFSALPTTLAKEWEPQFAAAGYAVVTNASSYRMTPDVPLLVPEVNPDHTALIPTQRANNNWSGFIVASPNCSTTSALLPLKVWQDAFGLEAANIVTLQAISGAGYPGVSGWICSAMWCRISAGRMRSWSGSRRRCSVRCGMGGCKWRKSRSARRRTGCRFSTAISPPSP
jgi:aspartate-semialdehyde dehydrogenase